MTPMPDNRTLTYDKLRRLIGRAQQPAESSDAEQVATVDYDWKRPHHFGPEQLAAMDIFARKTQEDFTNTFDTQCLGPFNITVKPIHEDYASLLSAQLTANPTTDYYLPLTTDDGEHCGFVTFTIETASILVALMLREDEQVNTEERKLSGLEDSILMDITGTLVENFSDRLTARHGRSVFAGKDFVKGGWPVDFEGIEDLTTLTYAIESPTGRFELSFTVLSTTLEPVLGVEESPHADRSPQQIAEVLMRHAHRVPVTVTGRLCTASIELDDIMNLQKGDLLLLGRKIAKPMDVLLNGNKCFQAFPASYYGKYALVVAPPQVE